MRISIETAGATPFTLVGLNKSTTSQFRDIVMKQREPLQRKTRRILKSKKERRVTTRQVLKAKGGRRTLPTNALIELGKAAIAFT